MSGLEGKQDHDKKYWSHESMSERTSPLRHQKSLKCVNYKYLSHLIYIIFYNFISLIDLIENLLHTDRKAITVEKY